MQPEKLADIMMAYLDCPCRYFAPMKDDDPLMEAYSEARERGKKEGFTPMIVAVEDILAQCIIGAVGGMFDAVYMGRINRYAQLKYRRRFLAEKKLR